MTIDAKKQARIDLCRKASEATVTAAIGTVMNLPQSAFDNNEPIALSMEDKSNILTALSTAYSAFCTSIDLEASCAISGMLHALKGSYEEIEFMRVSPDEMGSVQERRGAFGSFQPEQSSFGFLSGKKTDKTLN